MSFFCLIGSASEATANQITSSRSWWRTANELSSLSLSSISDKAKSVCPSSITLVHWHQAFPWVDLNDAFPKYLMRRKCQPVLAWSHCRSSFFFFPGKGMICPRRTSFLLVNPRKNSFHYLLMDFPRRYSIRWNTKKTITKSEIIYQSSPQQEEEAKRERGKRERQRERERNSSSTFSHLHWWKQVSFCLLSFLFSSHSPKRFSLSLRLLALVTRLQREVLLLVVLTVAFLQHSRKSLKVDNSRERDRSLSLSSSIRMRGASE